MFPKDDRGSNNIRTQNVFSGVSSPSPWGRDPSCPDTPFHTPGSPWTSTVHSSRFLDEGDSVGGLDIVRLFN